MNRYTSVDIVTFDQSCEFLHEMNGEVGVWGRRNFSSPRITEKRGGGSGGEILLAPG